MNCIFYRQVGQNPDVSAFAQGTFTHGYSNVFKSPYEFQGVEETDLVVLHCGLTRWEGRNQKILDAYQQVGIPVIILEFGRILPNTNWVLLNGKPWLPGDQPNDRLERLGFVYSPQPRGEDILAVGQRPELDREIDLGLEALKRAARRRVVWRPHPNAWRILGQEPYSPTCADELSGRCRELGDATTRDLQQDLDRAWCVVTHSSAVGIQALLRGIPVVSHDKFVGKEVATPLEIAPSVSLPSEEQINRFLCKYSYTIWSLEEQREGACFEFMKAYL